MNNTISSMQAPLETLIIIGASSAIAKAFIAISIANAQLVSKAYPLQIITLSKAARLELPPIPTEVEHQHLQCDYSQGAIEQAAKKLTHLAGTITRVLICNGILHGQSNLGNPSLLMPEKRLEDVTANALEQLFYANTIVPMLWLKVLTPLLSAQAHKVASNNKCVISILSARVGSISDNQLGGWYGYRASKAALNMLIKTTAIEYARRLKRVKLIAFHPGTTDTPLSKPFQANVPQGKLFTPEFVAKQLDNIMNNIEPDGVASYLDWQAKPITW